MKKAPFYAENARFSRLIEHYARKLKTNSARCDLWGFLWILLATKQPPPSDRYIAVCLRNEYIRLSKEKSRTVELLRDFAAGDSTDFDLRLDLAAALRCLTENERRAVLLTTMQGYTAADVATMLGISRQAVNQCKLRGFAKMRLLLCGKIQP